MDDLTSKSAARDGMMKYGFIAPDMTVHEFVEDELPSVPAVPLDKLCEWLASIPMMNCRVCKETVGFCDGKTNNICGSAEQWKAILTKWMEGLDGSESVVQKT